MDSFILESIYTKQDEQVPEYLVVVFETSKGFYHVGYGSIRKAVDLNLSDFTYHDQLEALKNKYETLEITDVRVTYDNDMYFLISGKFLLVLGFSLDTYTKHSINEFWLEEDIYGSNSEALVYFYELEQVTLPV